MAYYIEPDGTTILEWTTHKDGIRITTPGPQCGLVIAERDALPGIFATHPDTNPLIERDPDGTYVYTGPEHGKARTRRRLAR